MLAVLCVPTSLDHHEVALNCAAVVAVVSGCKIVLNLVSSLDQGNARISFALLFLVVLLVT